MRTRTLIIQHLRPHWRRFATGVLFLVLANLFGLAIPRFIGLIVDGLVEAGQTGQFMEKQVLAKQALALVGLSLVAGVCRFLMRWLIIGTSRLIELNLRNDFFTHLLALEPAYYQKTDLGDLMARSTNDLNGLRMLFGPGIMYSINITVTLALALTLMLSIDLRLTLFSLAPLPLLSLVVYLLSSRLHGGYEAVQDRFGRMTSRIQEHISAIRLVKAYGMESSESDRFRAENDQYYRDNLKLARLHGLFHPSMRLLSGSALALVILFGGDAVIQGRISLGDLVAFMQYLILLSWPMMALGWVTGVVQRGKASWGRIRAILDREPEIRDAEVADDVTVRGDLACRNLTLKLDGRTVLRDFSFQLAEGQSLGIVGPTGAGKSVLLRLLPRLVDPPPGSIFLGDRDLRKLPLAKLREAVCWVSQEPTLFSESLDANLRFGMTSATDRERDEAARDAGILDEILAFPEGWDSIVGERGVNLSGGQKQRLCLARALLRQPALLLLDDPFASVDASKEDEILTNLTSRLKGRSFILVSHRIATVSRLDRILVIDQGRIVQDGSHLELLAQSGLYRILHDRQKMAEALGEEGGSG